MKKTELFKIVEDVKNMLSEIIPESEFVFTNKESNYIHVYDVEKLKRFRNDPFNRNFCVLPEPIATFYFYKNKKVFGYGDHVILNMVRLILDEKDFDIR